MNNSIYDISSKLISSNTYFDFSQRVKSLNMHYDYNSYLFPIIYLEAYISIEEFRMIDNRKDLKMVLSLRRYETSQTNSSNAGKMEYCFKDKVFNIVNVDNYYLNQIETTTQLQSNSEVTNMLNVKFVLMSEEDINSNKKNVSGSFGNCSIKSILVYLMNKLNQNKQTIIAEPDNTTNYSQILLPFNNILNTFKYIDTVYGVYEDGMKIFFDLNKNYVLNKKGNTGKFNDNSLNKIIIFNIIAAYNASITDPKPNTIDVLPRAVSYVSNNTIRSESVGTNNAFILNNESKTILNKMWNTDIVEKQKVYYQKYSNPFLRNQLNPDNDTLISFELLDANFNDINFINEYAISESGQDTFKDKSFNVSKYTHKFSRVKDNSFQLSSLVYLNKI